MNLPAEPSASFGLLWTLKDSKQEEPLIKWTLQN